MTTKVTILNHGPNSIYLQPKQEGWQGIPSDKLKPGEFMEVHVHKMQDIEIVEDQEDLQQN